MSHYAEDLFADQIPPHAPGVDGNAPPVPPDPRPEPGPPFPGLVLDQVPPAAPVIDGNPPGHQALPEAASEAEQVVESVASVDE